MLHFNAVHLRILDDISRRSRLPDIIAAPSRFVVKIGEEPRRRAYRYGRDARYQIKHNMDYASFCLLISPCL